MNLASVFPCHGHKVPALVALPFDVGFLCLVFKGSLLIARIELLLTVTALFAGASWWITHIQS